jgi:hypothetical protein
VGEPSGGVVGVGAFRGNDVADEQAHHFLGLGRERLRRAGEDDLCWLVFEGGVAWA